MEINFREEALQHFNVMAAQKEILIARYLHEEHDKDECCWNDG